VAERQAPGLLLCGFNVEHFSFGEGLGHTPTAPGPQPTFAISLARTTVCGVGIWRIFDVMDELKLPMCHLLNAAVCEEMPQIAARIRQRGDEVIGHGYTNSERQSDMDEATEAAMIAPRDQDAGRELRATPLCVGWARGFQRRPRLPTCCKRMVILS